ncbi:restriction endonuclease subunit S [Pediococcus pentosaceus]
MHKFIIVRVLCISFYAWVLRKLGDIINVNSGRDYKHLNKGDIPVYGTGGYMLSVDKFLSDKNAVGIGRKGTINKPYVLYAPFWTVDTLFYTIPKTENDLFFISDIFQKINWLSKAESTGVPSLSKKTINNIKVYVPTFKEQQAIGSLFKKLDDLITLQQRKIDTLKLLKKALLQQIFPEKEEDIPRVRFANFSTKWKQRKLGELCDITTGKLDANAMKENGQYDFYTSGIKKYKIDNYAFVGPAITIAGNGATVGYMHLADYYFNAYQRTYVLTNFTANRLFLYVEIGVKLPKKIKTEARTGNIPYIVMDMLKTLKISVSSVGEQNQIGNCLNTFEQTVIVTSQKFKKLNQLKKTLLQNMFI